MKRYLRLDSNGIPLRPLIAVLETFDIQPGTDTDRRPYACACGRRFHTLGQYQRHTVGLRPTDHHLSAAPAADEEAGDLIADQTEHTA